MEESPLFNAGRGAVLTWDGQHELDASIMDGATLQAGAVAGVTTVKSPIAAARAVMRQSEHVMLAGSGAESFAASVGLEVVSNDYFTTERRLQALERYKSSRQAGLPVAPASKFGTVGVVVLDVNGNLAAGTSTGGMTGKRWGRIGDAPIIGAGTYADNQSCAVSATGHGEFFIRYQVASDICARVKYQGKALETAAVEVIHDVLGPVAGDGGVVAVAPNGNVAMIFNSEGMYRASIDGNGRKTIAIYGDDTGMGVPSDG
jgi:beta-aspartyl-peptidase (threonine type)